MRLPVWPLAAALLSLGLPASGAPLIGFTDNSLDAASFGSLSDTQANAAVGSSEAFGRSACRPGDYQVAAGGYTRVHVGKGASRWTRRFIPSWACRWKAPRLWGDDPPPVRFIVGTPCYMS